MKTEKLTENWVTFQRFHFKHGWIDKWSGDMADDPNRPKQSNIKFNASASWIRLNNRHWVNTRELPNKIGIHELLRFADEYDAHDVWIFFVDQLQIQI